MMKTAFGFAAFLLSLVGLAASECFDVSIAPNFDELLFFNTWPVVATAWTDAAPKCYVFAADRHNSSYFTMEKYDNMFDARLKNVEPVAKSIKKVPKPGFCTGLSAFNNVNQYEATIVATDLASYHLSYQCVNGGDTHRALLLTTTGVYSKRIRKALKDAGETYGWPKEFKDLVKGMKKSGKNGKCDLYPDSAEESSIELQ